jgi:transposase
LAGSPGGVRQVEHGLEALLAAEPVGVLRGVLRCPGFIEQHSSSGADARFYRDPRPCLGSGRKRGQQNQGFGRSRGGFSSKIHLKTDFDGLPIAFHLTGGEASDSRQFDILLDIGPDITPRAVITDKGYDARANRAAARQRGICPVIPYRENTVDKLRTPLIYQTGPKTSAKSGCSCSICEKRCISGPSQSSRMVGSRS